MSILGVHHVTSLAGDPGRNVAFFTEVLGLRLVKKTVNFDDPYTYHLYYGDSMGHPGTIITFFPYTTGQRGTPGAGQVTTTSFRIPGESVDYWIERFDEHDVTYESPHERFGETVIPFEDPDGLAYELVAVEKGKIEGCDGLDPWDEHVPAEFASRGFHGVTMKVADPRPTGEVLERMGYDQTTNTDGRHRYEIGESGPGTVVDLHVDSDGRGRMGVGCVHHVAFRTSDDNTQIEWQRALRDLGLQVTEVKDRQYFRSIYFREPGGVLFEIATDPPGFTRDEDRESPGQNLTLPPWLEADRSAIEQALPDIGSARRTNS